MGSGGCSLMLGDDGRGYELAKQLEGCGAWRAWLGDSSSHSTFLHFLSSPSSWDAFISSSSNHHDDDDDDSTNLKAHLHLQLRARALLFDKASIALFLPSHPNPNPNPNPSSSSHLALNPDYLQLHGDDVFFSLEEDEDDRRNGRIHHQVQSRPVKVNEHTYERASSVGSSYSEPENVGISRRYRNDGLPDSWYNQYFEKLKGRYNKFPHGDKESLKRTSEGMSVYLQLRNMHRRKRKAFREDAYVGINGSVPDNKSFMPPKVVNDANNSTEDDISFFPEIMFPSNCVPESSLPLRNEIDKNQKMDVNGILDNLPTVVSRSTAMMERFGIRPEYIKVGNKYRGIDGSGREKKPLCQKQASQMTHKIVARLLTNTGFEGGTGTSIEVFSEFFSSHICKLGRILKLLTDSYKKQFSSIELLQMFLQNAGYSNLQALIESTKDGNKAVVAQTPQHVRVDQSQNQNAILQIPQQQLQRQMHSQPQMNMPHSQNLTFQQQQQLEKLRRRQDQQQPMVNVKMENLVDSSPSPHPFDTATFNTLTKQQQIVMANQHALQSGQQQQQFRQLQSSAQIPQLGVQNAYGMRARPVKVEAFNELMGGDSTMKHEPEHNKLASPSK